VRDSVAYQEGWQEETLMKKNRWILLIFAVIALGVGAALFLRNRTPDTTHRAWPRLRIGYLPLAAELPLFVAVEQGYFKKAGIEVELTKFASSNEIGNAATADQIDVLAGCASSVIFDIGYVSGKKHLLFAVNPYSNSPNHVTDHLIVRKDSSISTLADLKGKRIASFPGSVNRIFTHLILEKYGVARDSYTYVELLPRDWQPSLASGAIDAVSAVEPYATQIIKDGTGVSIFPGFYADLMPDVPLAGHWIAADFYSRADKAQLSAFIDAYDQAIQFCREHEKEAKGYLVEYANVRPDIVANVNLNPWKSLSEVDSVQFQAFINLLADNKSLKSRVNFSEYLLVAPRR
jgi:NitT/TauT family transport system substrate-binding protein